MQRYATAETVDVISPSKGRGISAHAPGAFSPRSRRICTANPACQLEKMSQHLVKFTRCCGTRGRWTRASLSPYVSSADSIAEQGYWQTSSDRASFSLVALFTRTGMIRWHRFIQRAVHSARPSYVLRLPINLLLRPTGRSSRRGEEKEMCL